MTKSMADLAEKIHENKGKIKNGKHVQMCTMHAAVQHAATNLATQTPCLRVCVPFYQRRAAWPLA